MGMIQTEEDVLVDIDIDVEKKLVVYNDDVNTFDWVIQSLMDVCRHERLQAEQCTLLIHYKGRCSVKQGTVDRLLPMLEALGSRNLTAAIE